MDIKTSLRAGIALIVIASDRRERGNLEKDLKNSVN
ncbi:MAG: hypothetical protein PG979_001174 [Rickettsia asembonensis]|nr:MAG: hypothetical protein PG979_001174 [Rickettsia asembonensis]